MAEHRRHKARGVGSAPTVTTSGPEAQLAAQRFPTPKAGGSTPSRAATLWEANPAGPEPVSKTERAARLGDRDLRFPPIMNLLPISQGQSRRMIQFLLVAQWQEHQFTKLGGGGSNPSGEASMQCGQRPARPHTGGSGEPERVAPVHGYGASSPARSAFSL